ncbi:hypothetical protein OROHE_001010 [Orobanche hederae]
MKFLNSTISRNSQFSPASSFLKWNMKSPSRLYIPCSRKFSLRPSFSVYPRSVPSTKIQISARFGRPNYRQNYLRKKLTQEQQQQVSPIQHTDHKFDRADIHESTYDGSSEKIENIEKNPEEESKFKRTSLGVCYNVSESAKESETELRKKKIGESVTWTKSKNWVEQYRRDSEFWGIGVGPIFNIFHNSDGKVEKVIVNEDEIMRRSSFRRWLVNKTEDLAEVGYKISFAKNLAKEMESGSSVITKNSSVAKFLQSGGESRFMEVIRVATLKPGLLPRMQRVGFFVICGLCVIWAIKGLFAAGENRKEYTRLEKEMLRRKIKARTEKEKMVKGSVEIMQAPIESNNVSFKRPQLDKEELVNSIIKANGSNSEPGIAEYSGHENKEYNDKIEDIRAMARHARETERRELADNGDGKDYRALKDLFSHSVTPENNLCIQKEVCNKDSDEESETEFHNVPNVTESSRPEASIVELDPQSSKLNEAHQSSDGPGCQSDPHENSWRKKFRIIKSAKEAKDYLSRKHHKPKIDQKHDKVSANVAYGKTSQIVDLGTEVHDSVCLSETHDFVHPSEDYRISGETAEGSKASLYSGEEVTVSNKDAKISVIDIPGEKEVDIRTSQNSEPGNEISSFVGAMSHSSSTEADRNFEDTKNSELLENDKAAKEVKDNTGGLAPSVNKENWLEKNFHEFGPIVEKIGVGFKENYSVAREKACQVMDSKNELTQLESEGGEYEFEWMKDEKLREIVFKVRDNELSGRAPFHLITEEDKNAFFSGLEKEVQKENEKLLNLHEYLHSNIENLDYGADGISVYDPLEKIIPRWKVPPAETSPEFLNNFLEQRKTLFTESLQNSLYSKKNEKDIINKSEKPSSCENSSSAANTTKPSTEIEKDKLASSKTIIQSSDGSIKAGKRSGKEYWQHTKKWSEGFLESYNAETDPEVKAVMRDMGKDLDRWITEKEIQEAADLMDKIPEKGQKFIKQKLDKVKREVELFGAPAVVSKYREYAEEKEEDYLWWLDLPFVMCIELYTIDNEEQRVGFYSLEMGADLELDPKQYHVIAFEDAGDCKNLCYIIQAHMEMLGNGNAFVVGRPPKDCFREAKANGFSVTVIRKGQLKLNIDQTLEEVEEEIAEIGSKIYHDKFTKEHSVNINGLMKGVFGGSKSATGKRKRSKRKPTKRRRIKP